jgi:uncharacterized protein
MTIQTADIKRIVLVRLEPGDDILAGLQEAVKAEGITNGLIMNGLGSSQSYRYHVVASNELPPLEAFPAGREPRDIVAYSGAILNGRVHAHITFSDSTKAEGGHLEPGTQVLTFTIITIADLGEDLDIANWDKIWELEE